MLSIARKQFSMERNGVSPLAYKLKIQCPYGGQPPSNLHALASRFANLGTRATTIALEFFVEAPRAQRICRKLGRIGPITAPEDPLAN